jgi:hypothetical protein
MELEQRYVLLLWHVVIIVHVVEEMEHFLYLYVGYMLYLNDTNEIVGALILAVNEYYEALSPRILQCMLCRIFGTKDK